MKRIILALLAATLALSVAAPVLAETRVNGKRYGVFDTITLDTPLALAYGGTGNAGAANQVLVGAGAGTAPAWASNLPAVALPTGGTWGLSSYLKFNGANLSLNVTPQTWVSTQSVFQIGAQAAIWSNTTSSNSPILRLTTNAYRDASNNWKYIGNGIAQMIEMTDSLFRFVKAPSATAGDALTWSYYLTLGPSNNVTLGASAVAGTDAVYNFVWDTGVAPSATTKAGIYSNGTELVGYDTSLNFTTLTPHEGMDYFTAWYKAHPNVPPLARITRNSLTGEVWAVNDGAALYYAAHPEEARAESDIYVLVESGQGEAWDAYQARLKIIVEASLAAERAGKVKALVGQGRVWVKDSEHPEGGYWQGGKTEAEAEAMVPAVEEYTPTDAPQWIKDRRKAKGKDK